MKSLREQVGASLDEIKPSKVTFGRLLAATRAHIADSKVRQVSAATRFSAAYTAIRMLADIALHAHGYRTLSSRPGHHYTAIESLTLTGSPFENERTLAFSVLAGVRPMIEAMPLEKANEAYRKMKSGGARFRMVLTMSGSGAQ